LWVKLLYTENLEHEHDLRFHRRFVEALLAIPPSKRLSKGHATKLYIDAYDSQSSFFLKRMCINNIKSTFFIALKIGVKIIKRKYGVSVLEKQLKSKLLDYSK
jgi:hypothetical protein